MKKRAVGKLFGVGFVAIGIGLCLANASWLARVPSGHWFLIAQRGVHQVYGREGVDDATCTARQSRH